MVALVLFAVAHSIRVQTVLKDVFLQEPPSNHKMATMSTAPSSPTDAPKRSRPGRAQRRRLRKRRAIAQGHRVPDDRSTPVSSAVAALRLRNHWSDADEHALRAQLGYVPGNAIRIAARVSDVDGLDDDDDSTTPVVVELYPLVARAETLSNRQRTRKRHNQDGHVLMEPFPTLYWLTHPALHALVSQLELEGHGTRMEQRLQIDTSALEQMKQAHAEYGLRRQALLSETDRQLITERGWRSAIDDSRGVAGIRNVAAVKCLHAHVADSLRGGRYNIIGQWAMEEVQARLKKKSEEPENVADADQDAN